MHNVLQVQSPFALRYLLCQWCLASFFFHDCWYCLMTCLLETKSPAYACHMCIYYSICIHMVLRMTLKSSRLCAALGPWRTGPDCRTQCLQHCGVHTDNPSSAQASSDHLRSQLSKHEEACQDADLAVPGLLELGILCCTLTSSEESAISVCPESSL